MKAAEGWESPTSKRHSWRRKLDGGSYEYRYKDPSDNGKKKVHQEEHQASDTRIPAKLAPIIKVKEDLIRYNGFETIVCYDDDGNKLFDNIGNEDSAPFSGKEHLIKGNWLTHNHPRSSSFSIQDIVMLKTHEGKGIRVVSEKYDYEFCFLEDFPLNAEQTYTNLRTINMDIRERFENLIFQGKLSIEDANANHQHELMTTFSKSFPGVFYARKQHVR
jgi:hypothetical protein